ncbi:hypothetical protein SLE2022_369220 [Rubroshorea leprosula]
MRSSILNFQNLVTLFLISLMFSAFVSSSSSDYLLCGTASNRSFGQLVDNVRRVMGVLSELVRSQSWGAFSTPKPQYQVFGLGQCYGHLSREDCDLCFNDASAKLQTCLPASSGRVYLDGCFHRYDTYSFYHETLDPAADNVTCGSPTGALNDSYMYQDFQSKLNQVIFNVTRKALRNNGFAATEVKGGVLTVYALAQCWKTSDANHCKECLNSAGVRLTKCAPGAEGRAMFAGCYMRYSTNRFFKQSVESEGNVNWLIAVVVLSAMIFTVLAAFGAFIGYKRLSQRKKGLGDLERFPGRSGLNYNYEVLEKATEFFNESRKLGQGGCGSVFKGILPNGKTVAVKRLVFNTRQWVDQFFNEVNLISGIQHKNLVRLLGCSIEGPESLLVYEYVTNRSLDQIVFVKNTIHILSWQQRFNIICGTAEGLAYLHGGSGVKIIHRDIKTSNILLDENLTPKIADFGLARCIAPDKSHVSTAIAGTLGYLAPEYLVRGQLTEKADVYAFGVLALEVATGRKNSVFSQGSSSILYSVWKHYKANTLTQAIDAGLQGRFNEKEASVVLQVGLLCTQASAPLRPEMSEIVQMLTNEDYTIPSPQQPPFLNASVLSPDDTTSSSLIERSSLEEQGIDPVSSSYSHEPATVTSPQSKGHKAIEASSPR